MPAIHVVERLHHERRVEMTTDDWESGYWAIARETAERLIGGQIFLHGGQAEPSRFGGDILSFRVQTGGEFDGRIIFRFRPTTQCKGIVTSRQGWGNEKKVIW